jgi:hypothetical protein
LQDATKEAKAKIASADRQHVILSVIKLDPTLSLARRVRIVTPLAAFAEA